MENSKTVNIIVFILENFIFILLFILVLIFIKNILEYIIYVCKHKRENSYVSTRKELGLTFFENIIAHIVAFFVFLIIKDIKNQKNGK